MQCPSTSLALCARRLSIHVRHSGNTHMCIQGASSGPRTGPTSLADRFRQKINTTPNILRKKALWIRAVTDACRIHSPNHLAWPCRERFSHSPGHSKWSDRERLSVSLPHLIRSEFNVLSSQALPQRIQDLILSLTSSLAKPSRVEFTLS